MDKYLSVQVVMHVLGELSAMTIRIIASMSVVTRILLWLASAFSLSTNSVICCSVARGNISLHKRPIFIACNCRLSLYAVAGFCDTMIVSPSYIMAGLRYSLDGSTISPMSVAARISGVSKLPLCTSPPNPLI